MRPAKFVSLIVSGALAALVMAAPLAVAHNEIKIPVGHYYPFFKPRDAAPALIEAFWLDAAPVSRGQFREFVRTHPAWRVSKIKPLFAESTYLADWRGDLDPGAASLDDPVTHVSWFAARAYCAAQGKRLPTVAEWERIGGAGVSTPVPARGVSDGQPHSATPFQFAMGRPAADLADEDLLKFGRIWEWNADFNSAVISNDSDDVQTPSSLFCGGGVRSINGADYAAFLRYSLRSSLRASYALRSLGFRCSRSAR